MSDLAINLFYIIGFPAWIVFMVIGGLRRNVQEMKEEAKLREERKHDHSS